MIAFIGGMILGIGIGIFCIALLKAASDSDDWSKNYFGGEDEK